MNLSDNTVVPIAIGNPNIIRYLIDLLIIASKDSFEDSKFIDIKGNIAPKKRFGIAFKEKTNLDDALYHAIASSPFIIESKTILILLYIMLKNKADAKGNDALSK